MAQVAGQRDKVAGVDYVRRTKDIELLQRELHKGQFGFKPKSPASVAALERLRADRTFAGTLARCVKLEEQAQEAYRQISTILTSAASEFG